MNSIYHYLLATYDVHDLALCDKTQLSEPFYTTAARQEALAERLTAYNHDHVVNVTLLQADDNGIQMTDSYLAETGDSLLEADEDDDDQDDED